MSVGPSISVGFLDSREGFRRRSHSTLQHIYKGMNIHSKRHAEQINTLVQVWTALNPTKSYSGLSLREVRVGFQPSLDARARVSAAQAELASAISERDAADQATLKLYKRALSAIKADPSEGEEGHMMKAIISGTRKSRRSGVVHNTPAPATELGVVKPAA